MPVKQRANNLNKANKETAGTLKGLPPFFLVRPAVHVCLCGESPLTAREGEGLATRQSQGGNDLMKEADSK